MRLKVTPGRIAVPLSVILALALSLALIPRALSQKSADVEEGRQIFAQRCASCHNDDASGTGTLHTTFIPDPANLTLVRDAPDMMFSIVKSGIVGTEMGSHPNVTRGMFEKIRAYVSSQPPDTTGQWGHAWTLPERPIPPEMGREVFVTACSGCHGMNGDGKTDDLENPHIWPKPADFHARNSDLGRIYYIVTHGRPGTMMAPQEPKFPEVARWAVAQYVYSLYDPSSSATIPTGRMDLYRNVYSVGDQSVVQRGEDTYNLYCVGCHGAQGKGSFLAPKLIDRKWRYGGGTDNFVFHIVTDGIPGKLMVGHKQLTEDRRWAVITYIRHHGGLPEPIEILMKAEEASER